MGSKEIGSRPNLAVHRVGACYGHPHSTRLSGYPVSSLVLIRTLRWGELGREGGQREFKSMIKI